MSNPVKLLFRTISIILKYPASIKEDRRVVLAPSERLPGDVAAEVESGILHITLRLRPGRRDRRHDGTLAVTQDSLTRLTNQSPNGAWSMSRDSKSLLWRNSIPWTDDESALRCRLGRQLTLYEIASQAALASDSAAELTERIAAALPKPESLPAVDRVRSDDFTTIIKRFGFDRE